ncbi:MAG TPA: phosphotransferase, partial [Polyangiaceae bacterium]|nr:phosphotransferase [Polyangiaceae bacterium]
MLEGASWSGASGTVWLGRDPSGARVALKLSRADSESDSDSADESFAREVALLARLSRTGDPGVPALLDSGRHEGRPYLVMRFVEGRTLRAVTDELWPAQSGSSN